MTKDYIDFIQTIDYTDSMFTDNQESSDEFYGQPDYKKYVDEWC